MDHRASPEKIVLENGFRALVAHVHDAPLVAQLLLYRAGSACEPPGKSGLAHLAEHMMFGGTPAFPEGAIDEITGRVGGSNNAVTTADHAAYHFVVPAEDWRVPLEIEADRMRSCALTPERFETERRIVLEERGMVDDDPEAVIDEAIDLLAIDDHPYRKPVIGLREELLGLTLEDLRAFYARHYRPGNAILAIVGDFDASEAAREIEALFGGLEPSSAAPSVPEASRPVRTGPRRQVIEGDGGAPQIVLAYRVPAALHEDAPALEVLSALLAEGRGSRLHDRLVRDADLATDVTAFWLLQRDPSLFYVSLTLHQDVDPEAAEHAVLEILEETAGVPPSDDEAERAVRLALLDTLAGRESYLGLAGWLGTWESLDAWERGYVFEDRMRNVGPRELAAVARTYFAPEGRSSVWLVPSGE